MEPGNPNDNGLPTLSSFAGSGGCEFRRSRKPPFLGLTKSRPHSEHHQHQPCQEGANFASPGNLPSVPAAPARCPATHPPPGEARNSTLPCHFATFCHPLPQRRSPSPNYPPGKLEDCTLPSCQVCQSASCRPISNPQNASPKLTPSRACSARLCASHVLSSATVKLSAPVPPLATNSCHAGCPSHVVELWEHTCHGLGRSDSSPKLNPNPPPPPTPTDPLQDSRPKGPSRHLQHSELRAGLDDDRAADLRNQAVKMNQRPLWCLMIP